MLTSTGCSYLIVQGGNGAPSTTTQTVYALPLVSGQLQNSAIQGVIADKTQAPNAIPVAGQPNFGGGFTVPATTPEGMTTISDDAARVGAGPIGYGTITDMFVRGDTVFVTIFTPTAPAYPGIFYSQAMFNANGGILGWTAWQRAAGSIDQNTGLVDQVYAATFDTHGDFTMITGTSVNALTTVKRTVWGTDDNDNLLGGTTSSAAVGLVQMISAILPQSQAGVQGLVSLPPITPGLSNISMLVATGLNTVTMVQTGSLISGNLIFSNGDFKTNSLSFNNGTITENLPVGGATTLVVTVSGGALE